MLLSKKKQENRLPCLTRAYERQSKWNDIFKELKKITKIPILYPRQTKFCIRQTKFYIRQNSILADKYYFRQKTAEFQ